jgi:calcium binding protein 39
MCSNDLVGEILHQGAAVRIIELAGKDDFDISSEAFASLRELVLAYPQAAAKFLETDFGHFFGAYHGLVEATESYATRRRALKLLSEVLLSQPFGNVMVRYVSDSEFLQLHMNLMRDSSAAIRMEVFHVFKIFAANPRKPRRVELILSRNKERLIKLLENTVGEKSRADKALLNDLQTVICKLEDLGAETA